MSQAPGIVSVRISSPRYTRIAATAAKIMVTIILAVLLIGLVTGAPLRLENLGVEPLMRLPMLFERMKASASPRLALRLAVSAAVDIPGVIFTAAALAYATRKALEDLRVTAYLLGSRLALLSLPRRVTIDKPRLLSLYSLLYRQTRSLLEDPFTMLYRKFTPPHRSYESIVNLAVALVVIAGLTAYLVTRSILVAAAVAAPFALLALPAVRMRLVQSTTAKRVKINTTMLENELPYAISLASAICYSGLNISLLFRIGSKLESMPEFRRESQTILRYTTLFTGNILTTLEKIVEIHPSPIYRSFLNTIITLERVGGEKYAVMSELRNVIMRDLRSRAEAFIERLAMLSTFPLVFFMLLPMTLTIVMFIMAGLIPPQRFAVSIAMLLLILFVILYNAISVAYVAEFTEVVDARRRGIAAFALLALVALTLLPLTAPLAWLDTSKTLLYSTRIGNMLDVAVPHESLTPDRWASYAALLTLALAAPFIAMAAAVYRWYRLVQAFNLATSDLIRAIADRARLGKPVRQAIRELSLPGLSPLARRIAEAILPRLMVGRSLYESLQGMRARLGVEPPVMVRRVFEILDHLETVGVDPRSVTVFADALQQVYALRRDVARKVRNNVMTGLVFLLVAAFMLVIVKVALIDQLVTLSTSMHIPRGVAARLPAAEAFLRLFKPLKPEEKLEALTLSYYLMTLSAVLMGAILGKVKDNNVISAAFYAAIAMIILLVTIVIIPFVQPVISSMISSIA